MSEIATTLLYDQQEFCSHPNAETCVIAAAMDAAETARWVRAERERRGWSTTQLADRAREFAAREGLQMKLTQQSISTFEQGDAKRVPVWMRHVRMAFVDISYAMGAGAVVEDYPATGLIPFNLQFLRSVARGHVETLFVARGQGDSMMPTLINDDLVLIDTSQKLINDQDRIWAVSVGGAGMIKRIRRLPGDRFEIISDNPIVSSQVVAFDDLYVVGRVVWVGRRV
jgi:phage repressor protein C with HTH and peptisase S24 domain